MKLASSNKFRRSNTFNELNSEGRKRSISNEKRGQNKKAKELNKHLRDHIFIEYFQ